ncbi:pterin-4-alpha-carbinolamine dehydratase [Thermoanaerobaculum aquaticum]|uniref:Putative pterin-4-alpha-carbinolamine dehydratase n=1 Tax=Thermoanaerobaculum aquaticum TaxID=1312852 RepID=A0A062XNS0_9BACT|nr:4a-hydroxytetrahydrobiopterin dehydratase [Thermoanaerobaculum aquaticum]KDA54232.1 pterin-4-alpha-carbinolamine dehydratase [Thermoanaerobaculum aquaticum]
MPEDLAAKRCVPCEGGTLPLSREQATGLLAQLPGWALKDGKLERTFVFRDHYQAIAFVNAVAWISHQQDHHPLMEVGYKTVRVVYWTHAISGLSENDFICAARVSGLLPGP